MLMQSVVSTNPELDTPFACPAMRSPTEVIISWQEGSSLQGQMAISKRLKTSNHDHNFSDLSGTNEEPSMNTVQA
jgi:hypothetical protein